MQSTYLIISAPESDKIDAAAMQLQADINGGLAVRQLFFYSDAVVVGALGDYPEAVQALLAVAENHDIALNVCSAGFQKRGYHLSDNARQDFAFKGLGQFMAETRDATYFRVF